MTKQERIARDRQLLLDPHVSNSRKSKAVHRLYTDGVSWPVICTWLEQGTEPERLRVLNALANPNASEKQIAWAMKRLVATGMSYGAAFVWWAIHHDPATFSRIFSRAAKKLPHLLEVSAGE